MPSQLDALRKALMESEARSGLDNSFVKGLKAQSAQEISIDAAIVLLLEFVSASCSSADIKVAAKAAGAGRFFLETKKKASVWEELFCVSAGIAAHSISESASDRLAIRIAESAFDVQVFRQVRKLLGPENESANSRFQMKIRAYREALASGQDAISLSPVFLENLSKSMGKIDQSNSLQIVPIIASMQIAMRNGMADLKIVIDEDDE